MFTDLITTIVITATCQFVDKVFSFKYLHRKQNKKTSCGEFASCDTSEEDVCIGIIDTAAQEFGTIDVLVNNTGINSPEKRSPEITTKEWDEVLDMKYCSSIKQYCKL